MQIVISMTEAEYDCAVNYDGMEDLYENLKNGIVLPEGHGRLIDADKLEPDTEWDDYYDGWCSYSGIQIKNAPTIVEAEKEDANE